MPGTLKTDVLIVGGGLAGVRAAQAAADAGARCLLVTKASIGQGGASARASGGFATAVGKADSAEQHIKDTVSGGYGLNNAPQVAVIARSAPEVLSRLNAEVGGFAESGALFRGEPAPVHTVPRSVQYPHGMAHLMSCLRDKLRAADVELLENHRVVDLQLRADGRVIGGQFYSSATGELLTCRARAVVLAAGGCGQLFPVTSNGPDATGDAYALAVRAGCTLQDMEFIQYTPTAFAAPAALRGHTIVGTLLSIAGVRLLNGLGERFMERYAPVQLEGADRATLARAIFAEVTEGRGTAAGGVYLDATSVSSDDFNRHRPGFYDLCVAHGIDPCSAPLETAPAVHTCLGGIKVDGAFSAAPHLYVAGEALAGTHGANRLSSNSLTEANVSGWMAGENAAECAFESDFKPFAEPKVTCRLPARGQLEMADMRAQLQRVT
ncbi:MAG: FAD-dependent oxidoreductase, partial [Rhizobiales bacterium]|nr:FAD-dependent oxidoreductase [Hyphomicrobiales bacterium]